MTTSLLDIVTGTVWIAAVVTVVAGTAFRWWINWKCRRCRLRGHVWVHDAQGMYCAHCPLRINDGDYL